VFRFTVNSGKLTRNMIVLARQIVWHLQNFVTRKWNFNGEHFLEFSVWMCYILTFSKVRMSNILDVTHPNLSSKILTNNHFFSAGVIFLSVQQFGRKQKLLTLNNFKVCKVPLFVV
jgi:hypothetical protein